MEVVPHPASVEGLRESLDGGHYAEAVRRYFALPASVTRGALPPEEAVALAGWLRRNGNPDAALTLLRRVVRDYTRAPGLGEAYALAGAILLEDRGEPTAAYQYLLSALELGASDETEAGVRRLLARDRRAAEAASGAAAHAFGMVVAVASSAVASSHEPFMRQALALAARARDAGEVPVGALVVLAGAVVGSGFNQPIGCVDPTAHAEVLALRAAARAVGNYRLPGAVLYATVEPCLMCVGALVHARVGTIVYGAADPKAGAVRSLLDPATLPLNHRFAVVDGVLADESRQLLQEFFRSRRG